MRARAREFETLVRTPGMLVAKYSVKFTKLAKYAFYLTITEKVQTQRFVNGLLFPLYKVVASHDFTSYSKATNYAQRLELKDGEDNQIDLSPRKPRLKAVWAIEILQLDRVIMEAIKDPIRGRRLKEMDMEEAIEGLHLRVREVLGKVFLFFLCVLLALESIGDSACKVPLVTSQNILPKNARRVIFFKEIHKGVH